jgi:hypothetical protein
MPVAMARPHKATIFRGSPTSAHASASAKAAAFAVRIGAVWDAYTATAKTARTAPNIK